MQGKRSRATLSQRRQQRGGEGLSAGLRLPGDILQRFEAALKRQTKRHRKGLKKCQAKFSENAVHQSRVETRRLLSLLEVLGPFLAPGHLKRARAALKRYLDTFDDLRDTHVQLVALRKLRDEFPAAKVFCAYLRKREERFQSKTCRRVRRLKPKQLGKCVALCRQDIKLARRAGREPGAGAVLLEGISAAFARTQALRAQIDPAHTDTIHRSRIAFKKFRYMVEALAGTLPAATPKLLEQLHTYQTRMGEVQDAQVLLRAFEKFRSKEALEPTAAGEFRQALLERREQLITAYLEKADELLKFWPPERPARTKSKRVKTGLRPVSVTAATVPQGNGRTNGSIYKREIP